MGEIYLISTDEGLRYRVMTYEPGTFQMSKLPDQERLRVAVHVTPGAKMSGPYVAKVILRPEDHTDDYLMESTLPCNEETTAALFATGFRWVGEAREYAQRLQLSPERVQEIRDKIRKQEEEVLRYFC